MRRQIAKRIIAVVAIIAVLGTPILVLNRMIAVYPRLLEVGDTWNYQVVFPDSHGYVLMETVKSALPNDTYLIFQDDNQYINTRYLWLTSSWFEIQETQVSIGNMNARSTLIYDPPIQLIQLPLRVGSTWNANSTLTTKITVGNQTEVSVSRFIETRRTASLEEVRTPAGTFQAYKIDVISSSSLYETLWFSVELGQVVCAKFYNPLGEAVTQTLTSYSTAGNGIVGQDIASIPPVSYWKDLGSVIYLSRALIFELKIPYD